jgi:3-oxoacyl-[acyl-carrier protein] reductase
VSANPTTNIDLHGHVAIVTGANHGIGSATARALGSCGAAVVLGYLRLDHEPDPGTPERYRTERASTTDDLVDRIRAAGGRALGVEANLTDNRSHGLLFDVAERAFGPVDILVNNASGWVADSFAPAEADRVGRPTRAVSAASFDRAFSVDARGSALMITEFSRRHIARKATWGRIVGLTSGGPLGFPHEVSYGAAKAALENLTMSSAFELAPHGVTANIVHPPVTDTGWITPEVEEAVRGSTDLLHIAEPGQVGDVIAFLVSERAMLVTGNRIHLR